MKLQTFVFILLFIGTVFCEDEKFDEKKMTPTKEWDKDTKVILDAFQETSTSIWKKEINEIGKVFVLFYEDWSERVKAVIPKFDRSAKLNKHDEIRYVAVDCKKARKFCMIFSITQVPRFYYIKDYDHYYFYNGEFLHEDWQYFLKQGYQGAPYIDMKGFLKMQKDMITKQQESLSQFQENIPQIDYENLDQLKNTNQMVLFYSSSATVNQDVMEAFLQMNTMKFDNNIRFSGIDMNYNSLSITHTLQITKYPSVIYIYESGKYMEYQGQQKLDDLVEFVKKGYIEDLFKQSSINGDMAEKVQQIQDAEEEAIKAGKQRRRKPNKEEQNIAIQKILDEENRKLQQQQNSTSTEEQPQNVLKESTTEQPEESNEEEEEEEKKDDKQSSGEGEDKQNKQSVEDL